MKILFISLFALSIIFIGIIYNKNSKFQTVVNFKAQEIEIKRTDTKYILILSTWRSGSTFLGELLAQFPNTYYSYEPIHYLSISQVS